MWLTGLLVGEGLNKRTDQCFLTVSVARERGVRQCASPESPKTLKGGAWRGARGYSFTSEPFKWQLGDRLIGDGASRDQIESNSTVFLT